MRYLVNSGIAIILVLCALLIYKLIFKKQTSKKITAPKVLFVVFAVAIMLGLDFLGGKFPIENAFITFSSAESAYKYLNWDKIQFVIEGEKTAFVKGKSLRCVVPKTENGYKLPDDFKLKSIIKTYSEIDSPVVIWLQHYVGTNDYYICLKAIKGKQVTSDNRNSLFYSLEYPKEFGGLEDRYVYVKGLDDSYTLYIDDKEYHPSDLIAELR